MEDNNKSAQLGGAMLAIRTVTKSFAGALLDSGAVSAPRMAQALREAATDLHFQGEDAVTAHLRDLSSELQNFADQIDP